VLFSIALIAFCYFCCTVGESSLQNNADQTVTQDVPGINNADNLATQNASATATATLTKEEAMAILQDCVAAAIDAILNDDCREIVTEGLTDYLNNIAKDEESNFRNHLACLDQLKWRVVDSVQGFAETGGYSLTPEKCTKLLERGLRNAADVIPEPQPDWVKQRITTQLNEAIKQLCDGSDELKQRATQHLQELLGKTVVHETLRAQLLTKLTIKIGQKVDEKSRAIKQMTKMMTSAVGKRNLKKMELSFASELEDGLARIAELVADGNTDKRTDGERLLSFLWTNLLLPKSKQYVVSPISGFVPGFVTIPMEPLRCALQKYAEG
jgi:hypothetical protein